MQETGNPSETKSASTAEKTVARNEPCPCGSGKKYKRCCGVDSAPKLGAPKPAPWTAAAQEAAQNGELASGLAAQNGGLPFDPSQIDPKWMNQFSRAMQRLPKAQLQKFQSLMTRAMAGKDVSREAAELERVLPAELRTLMGSFQMPGMAAAGAQTESGPMSAEEARKIVEEAKASGQISETEANELLAASQTDQSAEKAPQEGTGFSKLWRKFTQKKT